MPTEVKLLSASSTSVARATGQVQEAIARLRERWAFDILSATPTIASNSTTYALVVALTVDVTLPADELAAFRAFTGQEDAPPAAPAAGGQRETGADLFR